VVADPYEKRAYSVDKEAEKIIKQRWAVIDEAKTAKNFAVLVGLKLGQTRLEEALGLKKKLEENGRTACVFAAKEIIPEVLMEFPTVDAYVNTACPRLSIDDTGRFKKPMLTGNEALVVVGELSWEELCRRGLFEN
jgi:2-(3-amino-3-carboxypropyl)histidine synthase